MVAFYQQKRKETVRRERWKLLRYDVGHQETPEMREKIRDWLLAYL